MYTYTVCTYFNACVYLATYFQFSSLRFDWKLTSEIKANEFSECLPRRVDRGSIIGLTCVVMNVLLYGSPLSVMCMVIQTRSVKSLDGCVFFGLVGWSSRLTWKDQDLVIVKYIYSISMEFFETLLKYQYLNLCEWFASQIVEFVGLVE